MKIRFFMHKLVKKDRQSGYISNATLISAPVYHDGPSLLIINAKVEQLNSKKILDCLYDFENILKNFIISVFLHKNCINIAFQLFPIF